MLTRLADLYGQDAGDGVVIGISLTHEQIAAMTGASRVTVTRTLTRLKDEGVIAVRGRQTRILDRKRLIA